MTLNNKIVFTLVILLGVSPQNGLGQLGWFQYHSSENLTQGLGTEPEEDDGSNYDVMNRLEQVKSVDEFMSLLRLNGQKITKEDLYGERNGMIQISGDAAAIATPDNCSPRNVTVKITMKEGISSDTVFYPRCIKMKRCGGCCSSPNLECAPTYTEMIPIRVLKGKIPYAGAPHLEYTGFVTYNVERHVICRVACKLSVEKCGPLKAFDNQRCTCKCKTQSMCRPDTTWDPETCSCKCSRVVQCCQPGSICGLEWDPTTCDCKLLNKGRIVIHGGTHTSTLTTAAPETTSRFDPCAKITCPRNLIKNRKGIVCYCKPVYSGRG